MTTIIEYQPYGGFPQWYTEDGFTDLLHEMSVEELTELVKAEVYHTSRTILCAECHANFSPYETAVWLDGELYCTDCFETKIADMPLTEIIRRGGLNTIEAIDG